MTQCKTNIKQVNENSEYSSEIQFLLKSLRSIIILALFEKELTKKELVCEIKNVFLTEPDSAVIDDLLDELWFEEIICSEYFGTHLKYSLTPRGRRKTELLRQCREN